MSSFFFVILGCMYNKKNMASKKIKNINDISLDSKNINKGSEYGNFLLEKSIQENGFGRSVLADKNGVLIGGNKTFQKATDLGFKKIKIIETQGDEIIVVQRTDIDINSKKGIELKILDNTVSKHNYIEDLEVSKDLIESFDLDIKSFGLDKLKNQDLDFSEIEPTQEWVILIELDNEKQCQEWYEKLKESNLKIKIVQ